MGHLEGGPHVGRDLLEGGLDVGVGHPQVVDLGAVEASGELAERDVAARPHVGEEGPHLVDRRLDLGRRAGQPTAEVTAHPAEVESLQHLARIRAPRERPETRWSCATLAGCRSTSPSSRRSRPRSTS